MTQTNVNLGGHIETPLDTANLFEEGDVVVGSIRMGLKDVDFLDDAAKAAGFTQAGDTFLRRGSRFVYDGENIQYRASPGAIADMEAVVEGLPDEKPGPKNGICSIYEYFVDRDNDLVNTHKRYSTAALETWDFMNPGLNTVEMVQQFMKSNSNLLILMGDPGTGKTSLLKQVLAEMGKVRNLSAAYVKDENVLKDASFWSNLGEPSLLILDDADNVIVPREEGRDNTFVSQLLSKTNGVFPSKMKVIITTNIPGTRIDTALTRPGRCFDVLKVPRLTKAEAEVIWKENLKMETPMPIEGDTVMQAHLVSEYERQLEGEKTYLTNKEISVRNNYL